MSEQTRFEDLPAPSKLLIWAVVIGLAFVVLGVAARVGLWAAGVQL